MMRNKDTRGESKQALWLYEQFNQLLRIAAFHHGFFPGNDLSFYQVCQCLVHSLLPLRRTMLKVSRYFEDLAFTDKFPYTTRGKPVFQRRLLGLPRYGIRESVIVLPLILVLIAI